MVTEAPGVYRMFDRENQLLYVGKAKNLKKRLSSYFRGTPQDIKTSRLVAEIARIEVTVTRNEAEALLLEYHYIQQYRPPYNVIYRDDKSYPYLLLTQDHPYPRLDIYRGPQTIKGDYFGPYTQVKAVHQMLDLVQKLFKIRQCTDHFFKMRTRPCLQYQINRCTAPCVDYIDTKSYGENVEMARLLLSGQDHSVIQMLSKKMEQASAELEFETAAHYRDLIANLRNLQAQQIVIGKTGDFDVIALKQKANLTCLHLLTVRHGRLLGNRAYFPKMELPETPAQILSAFIMQHYLNQKGNLPKFILCNVKLDDKHSIEAALRDCLKQPILIKDQRVQAKMKSWLQMALTNAEQALINRLSDKGQYIERLQALTQQLQLANLPQRMECFDVSHMQGNLTVASCVVFDDSGANKAAYRRFNIEGVTPGDDYHALEQALLRHYTKMKKNGQVTPDIIFIDGGKGQLHIAEKVLEELQITDVLLIGIAKGEGRKPGLETLFISGEEKPINLDKTSPALHLIQYIRDEAHRFAITGHRKRSRKKNISSALQEIPGIGAKRRRELLKHFGGMQQLNAAVVEQIAQVPGISKKLAQEIYDYLH